MTQNDIADQHSAETRTNNTERNYNQNTALEVLTVKPGFTNAHASPITPATALPSAPPPPPPPPHPPITLALVMKTLLEGSAVR